MRTPNKPCPDPVAGLAQALESRREQRHLSFRKLGRISGVDPGQVWRVCRGKSLSLSENVIRICVALDVAVPVPDVVMQPDPEMVSRLQTALMAAWDGSPEGANRLVHALFALKKYGVL